MEEVWKDVKGYEGRYQVSNMGRVKSLARVDNLGRRVNEKILRTRKHRNGYLSVILCKEKSRKTHLIHRLVLQNFEPVENMCNLDVNHLDENKLNNNLNNLEWTTHNDNCNHGTRNDRMAEKQSIPVVQLSLEGKYIRSYKSSHEAEREGGFDQSNINNCLKGRHKTHKGYRWCYLSEFIDKNCGVID